MFVYKRIHLLFICRRARSTRGSRTQRRTSRTRCDVTLSTRSARCGTRTRSSRYMHYALYTLHTAGLRPAANWTRFRNNSTRMNSMMPILRVLRCLGTLYAYFFVKLFVCTIRVRTETHPKCGWPYINLLLWHIVI